MDHEQALIPLRVHVRAGQSRPVTTWAEAGYQVSSYTAAELGPGLQCVAQQETHGAGGQIVIVAARFEFTAEEESVAVDVEPTVRELFALAITGLHELLGTLHVQRPDGSQFRALPVPGHPLDTADTWAPGTTGAEQGGDDGGGDHRCRGAL